MANVTAPPSTITTSTPNSCQTANNVESTSYSNAVIMATTTMSTATGIATIRTSTTVGPSDESVIERTEVTEVIIPTVEELMVDRRNITCTAGGCGKVLHGPNALRMHLNKTHGIYQNPEEKNLFSQKHSSISGPSTTVKKQYYCPVDKCQRSKAGNKPFPKISLLKQHYVGIHAEKIYQCSKCPSRFGMEKLRIKHEETCGVMYQCTCAAEYKTRGALISHAKYQKHQLPADFALRPQKQHQKELQKQQELLQKLERQHERKHQQQLVKQLMKQMEVQHARVPAKPRTGPQPILPKVPPTMMYAVPFAPPLVLSTRPRMTSIGTQTQTARRTRRVGKKSKKTVVSKAIQSGGCQLQQQHSLLQSQTPVPSNQSANSMCNMIPNTPNYCQNLQDSGMNTSLVSASHIETQTSGSGFQSTHTCTQTHGDVIVRNALLSANIETQTSSSHTQLVQSSTQYSSMYVAASAETQTTHPSLSLHQNSVFELDSMSVNPPTVSRSTSHPAVQTQTSATSTSVASSDAQTDNWLSALYGTPSNNSPVPDSPRSDLTQPADVPTQTDLSFLDMLNFSHSETQTMNSLASFMTESSSTQTPQITPNAPGNSAHLQSTEAQTHTAGLAGTLPLNTSQTQTSFADLCLGDVFLSESQSQTSPRVPFRLDDSLSSSHQQTQTGTLAPTWHQSTQTAAEKELDAALSLLNRYTQTNQTELRNDSPRPDSLSELEFTSMHTQTMEDVLAVLDNDNQSTSVQTDFATFSGDHRSFGVSTEDQISSPMNSNSGVAVQTDTLDLSSFQDLDFYSNSSSSSQT